MHLNEITADEYKQIQEQEITNWKDEVEQIEAEAEDIKMFKLVSKKEKTDVSGWIEQYRKLKKMKDIARSEGEAEANVNEDGTFRNQYNQSEARQINLDFRGVDGQAMVRAMSGVMPAGHSKKTEVDFWDLKQGSQQQLEDGAGGKPPIYNRNFLANQN